LRRVLLVLALALSQPVLAVNKCVINGKTVYQELECPQGAVQKPVADRVQTAPGSRPGGGLGAPGGSKPTGGPWPKLPELQPGKWTIEGTGQSTDPTVCGHPLQSLYTEYEQMTKLQQQGCQVKADSPRDRVVQVWVDCPADSKVGEVKMHMSVTSPNSGYVGVMFIREGRQHTQSAKRIGDC
jgi:hypothetical protein